MADKKKKPSKVEKVKEASNYLRAPVLEELLNDEPKFSRTSYEILKFHGSYQQDHRDLRQGRDKHWMFMIRGRVPGGKLTAKQYLAIHNIAEQYGDGTIRVTTRQAFQLYGVVKTDLKSTIREINQALITTLGACGDVVRNVMATPAPDIDGRQKKVQAFAEQLSDDLLPATKAYHETWLNGEKVYSGKETNGVSAEEAPSVTEEIEPLYGKHYLPRKFKVAVTLPGDNSIDLYTQDISLIALFDSENEIEGFNLVVGGGLGMNHKKKDTYPRLGDHFGYVPAGKALEAVKGIIKVQRDLGNRQNRKQARMKYLIDNIGLETFRQEVIQRTGFEPEPFRDIPAFEPELYLGWNQQSDGRWFLGLSIENGRIKDEEDFRLKTALRKVMEEIQPGARLTANQNILLTDVDEADKKALEQILEDHQVTLPGELSNLLKYSMACPALPTCGLAIAESERVFPDLIRKLEKLVEEAGLANEKLSVRMTGCPNGCARPYVADIGLVGRSLDKYTMFVGGNAAGTELGSVYKDLVPLEEIVNEIRPLLHHFKENRNNGERFGNYWNRVGFEEIRDQTTSA